MLSLISLIVILSISFLLLSACGDKYEEYQLNIVRVIFDPALTRETVDYDLQDFEDEFPGRISDLGKTIKIKTMKN